MSLLLAGFGKSLLTSSDADMQQKVDVVTAA